MKFLPLRTHSLWLLTKWALALVWFRVPLRVGNGKILTPAPLSVPSALLFVFVVAASNCRQTTNAKGKEKFKASCFSVPDKVRTLCCTLTISAKGWWTFQTQFVVMEMVIYVREVNVCPPPSDSENPVRTHQPRGRAHCVGPVTQTTCNKLWPCSSQVTPRFWRASTVGEMGLRQSGTPGENQVPTYQAGAEGEAYVLVKERKPCAFRAMLCLAGLCRSLLAGSPLAKLRKCNEGLITMR